MNELKHLQISLNYCDTLMKKKAVNFYHAFKNLDTRRFNAILGVYAFCRYVDDLVDEDQGYSSEEINEILLSLKKEIGIFNLNKNEYSLNESQFRKEPWFRAFINSLKNFPIQKSALYSQIEGQLSDLNFERTQTIEDLIDYSNHVAGSVGLILMPMIIGESEHNLSEACVSLGVAMQFTNILRDVGEDLIERRRIYIPSQVLSDYDLSSDVILDLSMQEKPTIPKKFIAMWEYLASQAEQRYDLFNESILHFDKDCRLALLVASFNYRAILDSVRQNNYNCLTERCYTSKARRVQILLEAKKALKD